MTEQEWLGCDDPGPMLWLADSDVCERGLRLFACACARRALRVVEGECYHTLLDTAHRYADHEVTGEELVQAEAGFQYRIADIARYCFWSLFDPAPFSISSASRSAVYSADAIAGASIPDSSGNYRQTPMWRAELATQCDLLRDIFGNPFRPVAFSPEWRTDTAVTLARTMYESREFGAMPILGDALQDAGCDSDDILNHCRDASATHVRGCWVVDLVLGKS